ncbi:hypothetical protein COLSTE_02581 [Collinsella stercoris DSM 13279]|uniref:Alpha/beta hydrolase n=1 Tax=Collinsella stercoris DSM 13279 TaxID=445975 RepID=B6GEN6_9ACTN|nr:hypothetical protein COLSTE_02581 [Collinsella stercoris DSM 13279]
MDAFTPANYSHPGPSAQRVKGHVLQGHDGTNPARPIAMLHGA